MTGREGLEGEGGIGRGGSDWTVREGLEGEGGIKGDGGIGG